MERFNLLPHRRLKRQQAQSILWRQVSVAALSGGVLALLGSFVLEQRISYVESYNATLNSALLDQAPRYIQAQRLQEQLAALKEKIAFLEQVDARRTVSVQIMNDLARSRPDGLYLTSLEENGERFSVAGHALNPEVVASFYEQLCGSTHLDALMLEEIHQISHRGATLYDFTIRGKVQFVDGIRAAQTERPQ